MDLMINGTAATRSSLGARRYFQGVINHLNWPGRVEVTPLARWSRLERLNELLQRGRADAVYWSPSHRGPLFAHRHVVTVLDCINLEHTYRSDWRLPILRRVMGTMLENASAVVAISQATRDAILRNFELDPSKVFVIAGPVKLDGNEPRTNLGTTSVQSEQADFVLMIANSLPHKNTAMAGRAFAASDAARRGLKLRVIGSMDAAGIAACRDAGVQVDQHRGVDDVTLNSWLQSCLFLFSPSLDEGLNLPVAEALSQGTKVLCSDIAVHREFYDERVRFCSATDQEEMTRALDEAVSRPHDWPLPRTNRPQRSFVEVADDYRSLFLRIAVQ